MSLAQNNIFQKYRVAAREEEEEEGARRPSTPPSRRYSEEEASTNAAAGGEDMAFSPMHGDAPPVVTHGSRQDDADDGWPMPNLQHQGEEIPPSQQGVDGASPPQRLDGIDYNHAISALVETGAWRQHIKGILRENNDGRIISFPFCCSSELAEGSSEFDDRDRILALQQVGLSHSDRVHRRILISIYRFLIHGSRGAQDPQTRGRHWEVLGFQGDDPATDLRATGMVGLLHILYAIQEAPVFLKAMFFSSQSASHEFPFALVCFNMSAVGVECLQRQGLHSAIRKHAGGGSTTPANRALSEFVLGCMFHFYTMWTSVPRRSLADFGRMKAGIITEVLTSKGVTDMNRAALEARSYSQKPSEAASQSNNAELTFSSF